jgi:hypothetical protein
MKKTSHIINARDQNRATKGALSKKAARADEMRKAALLDEAINRSNAVRYNASLARAKKGSVELLLHSRARGMSEASLIRIWGRELVSAARGVQNQTAVKSLRGE